MEKVMVEKAKLQQAQQSYRRLKVTNAVQRTLLAICIVIICVLSFKLTSVMAKDAQPIFVGSGTMEQIADNMYEIKNDPIEFEEIKLPPMPAIK